MKIAIISGSARNDNNTLRLARAIKANLAQAVIIDFKDYDIPNANAKPMSSENLSSFQVNLIQAIDNAELVFVLTPEYNWFPSAEIINTIHQLATDDHYRIFDNTVFAFAGVSAGRGGRMPAVQLSYVFDKIINVYNLESITSPKKFESQFITQCINEDGSLFNNEIFNRGLRDFIHYSVNVANRWHLNK